jgi:hypothetical protein
MRTVPAAFVVGVLLLVPSAVFAQASITGVVRDSSGGVLPGVSVEASSPALIEKVRTATTDSNGQYRIVDLRAGEYVVTFALAGFTTVRREGVTLEGSFTATINSELRVGALTETITVTGESPIVDVQSVKRQMVLDNDIISAIPSSRSYNNLIQLIPNSVNQAGAPTDVQVVPGMVVFGGFGGRSNEGRVNVDGISVGSAFNGAGVSSYIADVANAREIAMVTTGGLGENEGGGPSLNVLPKEGGNAIRGTFFATGATSGMVGSNYTQELRDRGLTTPGEIRKGVGLQPRSGWAHREGPHVVLREPARGRQRAHRAWDVRQQECRGCDEVDVCRGHDAAGGARGLLSHHRAASHDAGNTAQQVHRVLGPAATL